MRTLLGEPGAAPLAWLIGLVEDGIDLEQALRTGLGQSHLSSQVVAEFLAACERRYVWYCRRRGLSADEQPLVATLTSASLWEAGANG